MKEVTLIIPTHNRHQYLSRVLDYYTNTKVRILVADSTEVPYVRKMMPNVHYFHFPNMEILEKLNNIVTKVETKYIIFCADDDFWVRENIAECLSFMEKNNDYASVQGKTILFSNQTKDISFIPGYVYAENINLKQNSPNERVQSLMSTYVPLFYSMHRIEHVKDAFNDCAKLNIKHAILVELLLSLYTVIAGKNNTLDILTYARDFESSPVSNIDRTSLYDIHHKELFSDEYLNFQQILSVYLDKSNKNNTNSTTSIETALLLYLEVPTFKKQIVNKLSYKSILKKLLPNAGVEIVRKFKYRTSIKKIQSSVSHTRGYPISDQDAIRAWQNIKEIIIKHTYIR